MINKIKLRLVSGWHFQRILFLLIGTFIVIQSVVDGQWFGLFFGGYFGIMGLFGIGCASGTCYTGIPGKGKSSSPQINDVDFEEVKK